MPAAHIDASSFIEKRISTATVSLCEDINDIRTIVENNREEYQKGLSEVTDIVTTFTDHYDSTIETININFGSLCDNMTKVHQEYDKYITFINNMYLRAAQNSFVRYLNNFFHWFLLDISAFEEFGDEGERMIISVYPYSYGQNSVGLTGKAMSSYANMEFTFEMEKFKREYKTVKKEKGLKLKDAFFVFGGLR